MKQPVVDIKLQCDPNGIPKTIMDVLKRGPGKMAIGDLIYAANDCGYKCTLVIERPGAGTA